MKAAVSDYVLKVPITKPPFIRFISLKIMPNYSFFSTILSFRLVKIPLEISPRQRNPIGPAIRNGVLS
ncbi:hypothetical protein CEF21_10890 [Bacillus sp. FJAT-42376]|nr:hypothetical protein CEF21_10890 [Bacillus sp. FJAT-42376]